MGIFVALLRGINVGGKNLIKMSDLATCFEETGFRNVVTYIQSGNVLFESGEASTAKLEGKLEKALAAEFDYAACVVVRTKAELGAIVKGAPKGFGKDPEAYRYDVIYLKAPLTSKAAAAEVPAKDGVDHVDAGKGVLYYTRVAKLATQSKMGRISALAIYKHMTIRNWNTTTKMLELAEK